MAAREYNGSRMQTWRILPNSFWTLTACPEMLMLGNKLGMIPLRSGLAADLYMPGSREVVPDAGSPALEP